MISHLSNWLYARRAPALKCAGALVFMGESIRQAGAPSIGVAVTLLGGALCWTVAYVLD